MMGLELTILESNVSQETVDHDHGEDEGRKQNRE